MPQSLIDGTDPAQAQVAPRLELARALMASGADTSPAYPMQALARAVQPLAGHVIQRDAMSELAKLYSQQAGGMAEALRKVAPGAPIVAALESDNPMTQAMALRQAGPALMKLPEEAESARRFEAESGLAREKFGEQKRQFDTELGFKREQAGKPDFGPVNVDEYGRQTYGFREPLKKSVTPYNPDSGVTSAGAAADRVDPATAGLPRPRTLAERDALDPGQRYVAPDGQVRVRP